MLVSNRDLARRLVLVRVATFGYAAAWLVVRAPYLWDVTELPDRRFEPVGILALLDWRPGRLVALTLIAVTLVGAVLAAAGRVIRVAAPLAALATAYWRLGQLAVSPGGLRGVGAGPGRRAAARRRADGAAA